MWITGCFVVLLSVVTGHANKLAVSEIVEDIDGKPVHEVVIADKSQGILVVTETDVVQDGIQYESIVLVQDTIAKTFVLLLTRFNGKTCYVGKLDQILTGTLEDIIAGIHNGPVGESFDLQGFQNITLSELVELYGETAGEVCADADTIIPLAENDPNSNVAVGRKKRRTWKRCIKIFRKRYCVFWGISRE
ncbi:hypothetical protein ScPMuIL_005720 [Solemya velum]